MSTSFLHRGLVTYSDKDTGEIRVVCPTLTGPDRDISISYFGRSPALVNTVYEYTVPAIGAVVMVASDDEFLTNVVIVKTWS